MSEPTSTWCVQHAPRARCTTGWFQYNPVNQPQNYTQTAPERLEKEAVSVYTEPGSLHSVLERRTIALPVYLLTTQHKPERGMQAMRPSDVQKPLVRPQTSVEIGQIHA